MAPLGLPWWAPLVALAVMSGVLTLTQRVARNRRAGPWRGLAVMRGLRGRSRIVGLVVLAVSIQVARNWFVLHAIGVDISLFDSVAKAYLPVVHDGRTLGVLNLLHEARWYGEDDVPLGQVFAALAVPAFRLLAG